MLRSIPLRSLAKGTITIRVDYLLRVISLLLLIGLLTSCVPEEDSLEGGSKSNLLRMGDVQILWGVGSLPDTITFSEPFSEIPVITTDAGCSCQVSNASTTGFTFSAVQAGYIYSISDFRWQAIGRYK